MSSAVTSYFDLEKAARRVRNGQHRGFIGGMWDEIGKLQFEFVRHHGLMPDMSLIDIGCGCLRGGIHFVRYLDAGNYYGIDISQDLLEAGYERELTPLGLESKLPRENLVATADFDATRFGVAFDMALAQSLFTHLPLNYVKLCLARAAAYVKEGGLLFATFFMVPPDWDWSQPLRHDRGGVTTYPDHDPYHYDEGDLRGCLTHLPWRIEEITEWNHPRDQIMVIFRRTA